METSLQMNLRSFKRSRVYLARSIGQMQAAFPGVEFLRILFKFEKRKENRCRVHVSKSSIKRQICRFHVLNVKEMY